MAAVEPHRDPPEVVVVADDDAAVVVVRAGEEELGAVVPARDRERVVGLPAVLEDLFRVVEHRNVGGELWPPAGPCCPADCAVERRAGEAGGRFAACPEPVRRLELGELGVVVERPRAPEGILRLARPPLLGGDQDYALAGARAVDRARRGALQNLDVLDVIGVEVEQAVGGEDVLGVDCQLVRIVEGGRVVHRDPVHHEQRLAVRRLDAGEAADLDVGRDPGFAGRGSDDYVRRFGSEGGHQVLLTAPLDQGRVNPVAYGTELLDLGRRARAGHDHLAQLQWVVRQREVGRGRPTLERDLSGAELVADQSGGDRHRSGRDPRRRHQDGVRPVPARRRPDPQLLDRHLRVRQRRAAGVGDASRDDGGLLCRETRGQQRGARHAD